MPVFSWRSIRDPRLRPTNEPNDNLIGRIAAQEIATKRGRVIVEKGMEIDRAELADISWPSRRNRAGRVIRVPVRSVLKCEALTGRLPGVLRPLDGDRQGRADRRRGRHHRRAVDRRARHAADDADVPHRRRRRRGHHARPAARRGAVRGAQAEGPGEDRRGRRRGLDRGHRQVGHGRDHRRGGRGASPHVPAPDAAVRRRAGEQIEPGTQLNEGSLYPHELLGGAAGGPRPSCTSSARSRRSTSPRAWTSTTSTSS